ncbi:MAG: single-stranded DNA-binding protein [Pseudomonadota bacterium]
MNSLNIIGRVGKDAATKTVGNNRLATSWSVAVNVGWGDNKETLWFDCTMWGERGEKVGAHIAKGDQIGVTGSLSTREHDGKTYLKIDVQDVTLIGGKREGGDKPARSEGRSSNAGSSRSPMAPPPMDDFSDENIPFD